MRPNVRLLKLAALFMALFSAGITLGFGYEHEWGRPSISPRSISAAGNLSPSMREPSVANQSLFHYPATGPVLPAPNAKLATPSNTQLIQSSKSASHTDN